MRKDILSRSGKLIGYIQETCGKQFLYGWTGKLYGSGYNGQYYDETGRYLGNDVSTITMRLLEDFRQYSPSDF